MKPRDYCCCAIPLVNAGIYATLAEQLVLGIIVGTLSVATPSIVGAATPSMAPWILAVICYIGAGIQVLGLLGVAKEKAILYRRYVTLHTVATLAAFAVAAVWIIISASRHSAAATKCETDFFSNGNDSGVTTSEGKILCDIFPWVDVGIMGALWLLFAATQFYFYIVVSSYGTAQRRDHEKYDSLSSPTTTQPLANDIPMNTRSDPWDTRPAGDLARSGTYGHLRQDSAQSVATVLGDKVQTSLDGFSSESYGGGYGGYNGASYPPARQPSKRSGPAYPANALTQEPVPTPRFTESYYTGGASAGVERPHPIQTHLGES